MNGVSGHYSALQGCTGPEISWANKMNIVMNYASFAGSIAQPIDQQSCALPLCYGCPLSYNIQTYWYTWIIMICSQLYNTGYRQSCSD